MKVTKALPTGFWMSRDNLTDARIHFKYERLQDAYCLNCGVLGHGRKERNKERVMASWNSDMPKYTAGMGVNQAKAIHVATEKKKEQCSEEKIEKGGEAHGRTEYNMHVAELQESATSGVGIDQTKNMEKKGKKNSGSQGSREKVRIEVAEQVGEIPKNQLTNGENQGKKDQRLMGILDKVTQQQRGRRRQVKAYGILENKTWRKWEKKKARKTQVHRDGKGSFYLVELASEDDEEQEQQHDRKSPKNWKIELANKMQCKLNIKRKRDAIESLIMLDSDETETEQQTMMMRSKRGRAQWKELSTHSRPTNDPQIFIGDFNDILDQEEKVGLHPKPRSQIEEFRKFMPLSQIEEFRKFINYNELMDLDLKGGRFTWFSNPRNGFVTRERLDRALANWAWRMVYQNATLTALPGN
ncbi:hypothetical protein Ahy_A02g006701 [Arachis hypogaea]|uniref:Zinc knuckle CX2CX4HX4C domain-containing protein n=1 Tax=Arachis hypogaea TaxID=3818 RepID=A0A445EB20_ARAHY|nr:hypothetical protein Ahy_A02g006701 [Arachis hypogaea]